MSELKELIDPKDLKVEPYPVSPPGGQHVGVISHGVKITHEPTEVIVMVNCERTQLKNRNLAISIINFALNQLNYDH